MQEKEAEPSALTVPQGEYGLIAPTMVGFCRAEILSSDDFFVFTAKLEVYLTLAQKIY